MKRIVLWAAAALVFAACSGAPAAGLQEVTLKAIDINYEPKTIEVVAGQPVKLTLMNTGVLEHDFNVLTIDVKDVKATGGEQAAHNMSGMGSKAVLHIAAPAGDSAVLEFTPTTPGLYEFFCDVPGHKDAGAVGQLIVK